MAPAPLSGNLGDNVNEAELRAIMSVQHGYRCGPLSGHYARPLSPCSLLPSLPALAPLQSAAAAAAAALQPPTNHSTTAWPARPAGR
jgi:hypothetical protein